LPTRRRQRRHQKVRWPLNPWLAKQLGQMKKAMIEDLAPNAPHEPPTEEWWRAVVEEARTRLRLDQYPGDIVRVRCSFCRRSHQFARAELLDAYGAGYSIVTLQQFLMPDCKHRRNDGCMAVIVR
jgi:hypothetical protein